MTRVSRSALFNAARVVFVVAVAVAIVHATMSQWPGVRAYLATLAWPYVLAATMAGLLAVSTATMPWRSALAGVGHSVPLATAANVYLGGVLAKYLPGSVWSFVLQMELGKRARLPWSAVLLASLVQAGIDSTVALALGLFCVPILLDGNPVVAAIALVLAPVALVLAHPRILTWLLRRVFTLFRRDPTQVPRLTWPVVVRVAGWSLAMWLAFGAHLWLLARSAAPLGPKGYLICVAAMGLGQVVGMVAILIPSGFGVREVVIVAVLSPFTNPGAALGIALTSRLMLVVADAAAGLAALGHGEIRRRLAARRPNEVAVAQQ
jgi:uncharacterized membrane protein YbhN (UPF0104 family)